MLNFPNKKCIFEKINKLQVVKGKTISATNSTKVRSRKHCPPFVIRLLPAGCSLLRFLYLKSNPDNYPQNLMSIKNIHPEGML